MEKIREENHLMLATHERLQQDEAACRQQLDETRDHLLSQGEELRRIREAGSESQAEEKLQEVLNKNGQLEKHLQEIEILNQNYAMDVDKLQLELDHLKNQLQRIGIVNWSQLFSND